MARKNRILSEKELEELMMNDESDFSEDSSDESGTSSEEETIVCNSNSQKSDSTSKSNCQTYIGSTPTVSDNITSTIEIGGHNVEVSNAADTEVYLDPVFLDDLRYFWHSMTINTWASLTKWICSYLSSSRIVKLSSGTKN